MPHPKYKDRHVGFAVKRLNNQIRRAMDKSVLEKNPGGLSGMQVAMLGYIGDNSETGDVFQRDLEKRFNIRRPTATTILQQMEKNGIISREPSAQDGRLKRILLTEKGKALQEDARIGIEELEARMIEGVPKQDVETFFAVAQKMAENLKKIAP